MVELGAIKTERKCYGLGLGGAMPRGFYLGICSGLGANFGYALLASQARDIND